MSVRLCEFCEEAPAVIEHEGRFFCGFDCFSWAHGQRHREAERRNREAQQ